MAQSYKATKENMEVRKVEIIEVPINENVYKHLLVHFDDENGDRIVLKDKVLDNIDLYKRGTIGTVTLSISDDDVIKTSKTGNPYITEKTTIRIHNFVANE